MSPRTPQQNKQIRAGSKLRIVEAAFRLISKKGYDSTSISMIAKEAGVSKGLLYNYFDSKEDLVKALVMDAMEEGDQLMGESMGNDPIETLRMLIKWFFKEMRERPEHWRLVTELTFQIEKFDFVHEMITSKINEYIAVIEMLLTQIGHMNALGEARVLAALFDGIGFHVLMVREEYPLDEMEVYLLEKYCDEEK